MLHSKGENIKNDKLSLQSKEFAVAIIRLVRDLKKRKESIISGQIGKAARRSARISAKLNMHTAQLISFLKCILRSRKRTKLVIG